MQVKKTTTKAQSEKFAFELTRPVEETIAMKEFLTFITVGAASNVPKFPNRAKAFDWWTKTLWYDCRSALDTLQAKALRQILHKDDYLEAKDAIEDSVEFLNLFGTARGRDLQTIPAAPCSQFPKNIQALMTALNNVRVLGLKAGIVATPIVYPPAFDSEEEEPPESLPPKRSSWTLEDWDEYWFREYGVEEDLEFCGNVRRKKRKPKPSLGESQVLPPEITPGIEAKDCPVREGKFGLPRTIAESLLASNLEGLPEFKTASSYTDKVTALDNCITRILEMCRTDKSDARRILTQRKKKTGLKKRLLKDLDEILLLVFSFCARNDLCNIPRIGSQWSTYSWFTRFLPAIIEGLTFLRIQFDREFPFIERQMHVRHKLLLTYCEPKCEISKVDER